MQLTTPAGPTVRVVRRPVAAPAEADRRGCGVRVPAGANASIFGGWGVRF